MSERVEMPRVELGFIIGNIEFIWIHFCQSKSRNVRRQMRF